MSENFASTKFWLTVLAYIFGFVLVMYGKLPAEWYAGLLATTLGIYSAANVVSKFSE